MRKIPDRRAPVPPQGDRAGENRSGGPGASQTPAVYRGAAIKSARQGGSSFAARFGRVILQNGIAAIPTALYHYQGRMGLSAQQVWFISYVLSHKWDEDLPYPSLKKMAKVTGFSLSQLQRIKNGLCQAGLLKVYPRYDDQNGQGTNAYDFSGLFDVLEKLIMGDGASPNAIRAEGEGPDMSELGEVDPSFVARYGRVITRRGVAAVPRAIFTHQAELRLTAQQVWFITYIFSFQWDTALPYPSIRKMSAVTGYSSVQLHNIKTELVEEGYLRLVKRATTDGGQDTNAYDFSGLLDAIRELVQPEKKGGEAKEKKEVQDIAADLVPVIKRRGRHGTVQTGSSSGLPEGGRNAFSGRDSTELIGGGRSKLTGGDSVQFIRGDRKEFTAGGSAELSERDSMELATPGKEGKSGRSSSRYQRGIARDLHEIEALNEEYEKKRVDSNHLSPKGKVEKKNGHEQTSFSPYIAAIITDFSNELNDPTHVVSNVTQALRLWQMSALEEQEFTELLFEARRMTRSYQGKQGLGTINNKMAYFFKVVRDLEHQARQEHGDDGR